MKTRNILCGSTTWVRGQREASASLTYLPPGYLRVPTWRLSMHPPGAFCIRSESDSYVPPSLLPFSLPPSIPLPGNRTQGLAQARQGFHPWATSLESPFIFLCVCMYLWLSLRASRVCRSLWKWEGALDPMWGVIQWEGQDVTRSTWQRSWRWSSHSKSLATLPHTHFFFFKQRIKETLSTDQRHTAKNGSGPHEWRYPRTPVTIWGCLYGVQEKEKFDC